MARDIKVVKRTFEDNGFVETDEPEKHKICICWKVPATHPNHFSVQNFLRTFEVTKKDLYKKILRMQALYGENHFCFIPQSFLIPSVNCTKLKDEMEFDPDQQWIVKPIASCAGKGIYVTQQYSKINLKRA